jgi:hypothetical protein
VDVGKQDCNEIIQDLRALEVENNELLQEKQNLIEKKKGSLKKNV